MKTFKYLIKKYPDSEFTASAIYNSGRLYQDKENYRNAYLLFRRLIGRYPDNQVLVSKAKARIQLIKEAIKEKEQS